MKTNVIISLIVGALFLALAFQGIEFTALWEAMATVQYLWVVPAVFIMALLLALRTLRLMFILAPTKRISFRSAFSITCISFMAINLLPARLGEFVRPYLLLEKEDISLGTGFAAILVARLFDFLSMVLLIFGVAMFVELPSDSIEFFGERYAVMELGRRMAIFLAGPALGFVVLLFLFEKQVMSLAKFCLRPVPDVLASKILEILETFIKAMNQIRDPKFALGIALYTAAIWSLTPLGQYSILLAFAIPLGFSAAVTILTATLVGLLIPAPPGFAGTFEYFTKQGLALFEVTGETALAFALVVHGVQFVSVLIFGLLYLWKDKLSFTKIAAAGTALKGMKTEEEEP